MKYHLTLIALAATCVAVCAGELVRQDAAFIKDLPAPPTTPEDRITNGFPRQPGDVPYIVGLVFHKTGYWWCGGSIISHTWVLTAAHCTDGASEVTIYYGATRRQHPKYTHTVASSHFVQNPNYNSAEILNDVSLIRTPHVEFTKFVNRVELPRFADRHNSYAGEWARVSGWGKTSDAGGISNVLNSVDLQLISNAECVRYYMPGLITDSVLCAATHQAKSSCSGDSGGPLVLRSNNHLVGVVSFGPSRGCTKGIPAGFSRVTSFLDWIKTHTGIAY